MKGCNHASSLNADFSLSLGTAPDFDSSHHYSFQAFSWVNAAEAAATTIIWTLERRHKHAEQFSKQAGSPHYSKSLWCSYNLDIMCYTPESDMAPCLVPDTAVKQRSAQLHSEIQAAVEALAGTLLQRGAAGPLTWLFYRGRPVSVWLTLSAGRVELAPLESRSVSIDLSMSDLQMHGCRQVLLTDRGKECTLQS